MKIYIVGHLGMVESAIWPYFEKNKEGVKLIGRNSKELDLTNQNAVYDFIASEQPDLVINAAAYVGGILANNDFPYQFLMESDIKLNKKDIDLLKSDYIVLKQEE